MHAPSGAASVDGCAAPACSQAWSVHHLLPHLVVSVRAPSHSLASPSGSRARIATRRSSDRRSMSLASAGELPSKAGCSQQQTKGGPPRFPPAPHAALHAALFMGHARAPCPTSSCKPCACQHSQCVCRIDCLHCLNPRLGHLVQCLLDFPTKALQPGHAAVGIGRECSPAKPSRVMDCMPAFSATRVS